MIFKTLFAIIFLSLAGAAASQVVSQAYEVSLSSFNAPASENGGASFKTCETCEQRVVRVTAGTRYDINGRAVRLEDFRKALLQVNDRNGTYLTVLHHLESDTVKSISILL